ncbi:MAG: hypothetical protein ACFFHV_01725 [Promethearchaeota archaeon]
MNSKQKIKVMIIWISLIISVSSIFNNNVSVEYVNIRDKDLQRESNYYYSKNPLLSSDDGWKLNGKEICEAQDAQGYPQICSDGTGGAIVTWHDNRNSGTTGFDIYTQRINATGNVEWTPNGILICEAQNDQGYPQICSDGAGGAIIIWEDARDSGTTLTDIYAQRINASGDVEWTPNGVVICQANSYQYDPQICSDGAGGAVITWYDYRDSGTTGTDIYAQRINASGDVEWTPNGVVICQANSYQYHPQICGDGAGGAVITWYDYRSSATGYDIYAQRINASGDVEWTFNGVVICQANSYQYDPQICSDGAGGAVITWYDYRNSGITGYDIYAQRINASGDVEWTLNGVIICRAQLTQDNPQICSDGAGGAIITWVDGRNSATGFDIYAQRINASGNVEWISDGVVICQDQNGQGYPQICSDGAGGAIITWQDARGSGTTGNDIYAQRINAAGNVEWIPDGGVICQAIDYQNYPQICSDGAGGAIITWHDNRNSAVTGYDIYAQHFEIPEKVKINYPESKYYNKPMSGYFQATYGFENDRLGNNPKDWSVYELDGNTVNVIGELAGHKNVVEMNDISSSYSVAINKSLNPIRGYGTVEWWWRISDATDLIAFRIHDNNNIFIYFRINQDKFQYDNGSLHDIGLVAYDNTWYHCRVDFECTTGSYMGLSQYSWCVYINGTKFGNYGFRINRDQANEIWFDGSGGLTGYTTYIDAIGYSWDPNYNIGDNLNEGLLLSFETSENLIWMAYSLDDENQIEILGNTTIPVPEEGPHFIQVLGTNHLGFPCNSEKKWFNIKNYLNISIDFINLSFSSANFIVNFYIYDENDLGIGAANIQAWWDGLEVPQNKIFSLGKGFYQISLSPITVSPGEDPILLNMSISAEGCYTKYYEIHLAVDPEIIDKGPPPPPSSNGDKEAVSEELPLIPMITVIGTSIAAICIAVFIAWKKELFARLKRK